MSVKWINYVWEQRYRGGTALVALALADYASDEGMCFPSQEQLARKTGLSERQIRRILSQLEGDGLVKTSTGNGRGNRTQFQLIKADIRSRKADICDTERRTFVTQKGGHLRHLKADICDIVYKEEPSLEPSLEPSGENPPANALISIAPEMAIQAVENAFAIRLDLATRRLVVQAVPPDLIDRFPAFISGRAVGWANKSPTEKLAKIGYALTDFQKENKNAAAKPSYQEQREQRAVSDHNSIEAIRRRVNARKLSGADAGDRGGQLRMLVAKPDDGGEDVAGGNVVEGVVEYHP